MKKLEQNLINNRKLIIEVEQDLEKGSESVKTYIINATGGVEIDSIRITCTCGGKSVTRNCNKDGYCDCSGGLPKVICT